MRVGAAVLAGVIGALVVSVWALVAGPFALPVSLALMLGTLFGAEPSLTAWLAGVGLHLFAGALFGVAYAAIFEMWPASAWRGGALGLVHALFVGILIAVVPPLHPLVPEPLPDPAPYLAGFGFWAAMWFFAAHIIFGTLVGTLYAPAQERTTAEGAPRAARARRASRPETHAPI